MQGNGLHLLDLPTIYVQNNISAQLAGALTASVAIANAVGTFGCGLMLQRGFQAKTLVQVGFAVLILCSLSFYLFKDQLPFILQYLSVFSFSLIWWIGCSDCLCTGNPFCDHIQQQLVRQLVWCCNVQQFRSSCLPPVIALTVDNKLRLGFGRVSVTQVIVWAWYLI